MNSLNRREFLGAIGRPLAVAATVAVLDPLGMRRAIEALASIPGTPEEIAADESFWFEVQQAFTVDRSLVNLNNGGVSPAPAVVQDAMKRHLDYSNEAPVYTMWRILEPQREGVRNRLARAFKCSPEEIALTRNASESLQICQLGLDFKSGDEVLTTTQDYGRMITTFRQRERREGIKLNLFAIPVPAEDPEKIVELFEKKYHASYQSHFNVPHDKSHQTNPAGETGHADGKKEGHSGHRGRCAFFCPFCFYPRGS